MNKIFLSEICYYVFWVLLLTAKGAGLYDGQTVFKIFLVAAMAFWLAKMVLTAYTPRELTTVFLLLMLGGIVYLVSGEKGALLYIMMVTGLKNVPIKRVFFVGAVSWGIVFTVNVWVHAVGLLEGPFKVHDKFGLGMVIRWGLGYSHPNVLHVSYLLLVIFLLYILEERFCLKWALCLMAGNVLIFLYSLSSTGVIATTICLVLGLYWQYRRKLGRVEQILIQMVFPVCVLWSLLAPVILQGNLYQIVDDVSNTRLRLAKYFLTLKPPTLLGTRLSDIITNKLTMDNSYVFAFVTYGILLSVVIFIAYSLLVYKYCRQQKGKELCIIITILIAGIMEPFLFNTSFKNVSLLFMKDLIYDETGECRLKFLHEYDREVTLPFYGWKQRCGQITFALKNYRRRILLICVLGCLLGVGGYFLLANRPNAIIVPKIHCDIDRPDEQDYIQLSLPSDANKGEKVIGYIDSETPMIRYTGNIIWLEQLRRMMCSGFTMGAVLSAAAVLMMLHRDRKDAGRCEKDTNRK